MSLSLPALESQESSGPSEPLEFNPRQRHARLLRSWLFPLPVQSSIWVWGGVGTGEPKVAQRQKTKPFFSPFPFSLLLSGKTHTVRSVFARMKERVAFVDCASLITASKSPQVSFFFFFRREKQHSLQLFASCCLKRFWISWPATQSMQTATGGGSIRPPMCLPLESTFIRSWKHLTTRRTRALLFWKMLTP